MPSPMFNDQPDRAIDVNGLGKRFGTRWVLRGAAFGVRRGEVVGLMGPNGSGKSTMLRIVATLLKPNAGTAAVNGLDVVRDASRVRGQVGYLAHNPGLYDDLTARENLRFAAEMLALPHSAIDASLDRVGLTRAGGERVRGFSAGMQRRLAFARLFLGTPQILLLDEPYSNLDAQGAELMNALIASTVRAGGAALMALHELAPAKGLIDRTLTLVDGRIPAAPPTLAGRDRAATIGEVAR